MLVNETTYYLEMRSPDQLRRGKPLPPGFELRQATLPSPELSRFLYTAVGGLWYWVDRLPWTLADWAKHQQQTESETWVLYAEGTPAGYFELELQRQQRATEIKIEIELAYFGLLPAFIGQGLGSYLLTAAVDRAWSLGATRVWVHTSSLDHPHALAAYQARGFELYHQENKSKELPDEPIGPWPGSDPRRLGAS
jgi:GNAT superfamily N-acetyltransferase